MDGICIGHVLHRVVEIAFVSPALFGKLHATSLCQARWYLSEIQSLAALIERDLATGFYPGQNRLRFARHTRRVMSITLLRARATRGRSELESPAQCQLADDLLASLSDLLNGDLPAPVIQHYCWKPGCCAGHKVSVCRDRILGSLTRVFDLVAAVVLASNNWWSFPQTLIAQDFEVLSHSVLPSVLQAAQSGNRDEHPGLPHQNDRQASWAESSSKKCNTSVEFMSDQPASAITLTTGLVVLELIAKFFARPHHLDSNDHTASGMITSLWLTAEWLKHSDCLLRPSHAAASERTTLGMPLLLDHFKDMQGPAVDILVDKLLGFPAQVWARLYILSTNWP